MEDRWRRLACGQSSVRVPGSSSEKMNYYELLTTKNAVIAVTGAGAIYLLAKTLLAVLRSPSFKSSESCGIHGNDEEFSPQFVVFVPKGVRTMQYIF